MSPAPSSLDCIVVGSGWAGLWSALRLSQAGHRVVVLEARKRLGGRAFTHTWDQSADMANADRTMPKGRTGGFSVDFGCSYIHGYNEGNPVKEIAKKFGVQAHVAKQTTTQIIGPDGILPASLAERLLKNLQAAQEDAKKQGKELRANHGSSASPSTSVSLGSAMFDEQNSPLYAQLSSKEERSLASSLSRLMHIPLGVEMEQVALQYFGHEKNFAGTDAMPEGGFSILLEKVARQIEELGGQIKLGEEVQSIQKVSGVQSADNGEAIKVVTRSQSEDNDKATNNEYTARTTIVTVPLAVLKTNLQMFEPALHADRQDAIKRTNVGNLNKVLLAYENPWWQADIGTFFVLPENGQASSFSASSDATRNNALEKIFASSTLIVSSLCAPNGLPKNMQAPALLVMIGAAQGKQLEMYDRIDVAQALHAYLVRRLSPETADAPRHAFYSRWARQAHTGGATTTPITVGNTPADFDTLAKPDWNDTLFFAGEHCDVNHRGSIAGAVVSAQTASDAVVRQLSASARM